jgi:superfamily II DNA or RNA helicase
MSCFIEKINETYVKVSFKDEIDKREFHSFFKYEDETYVKQSKFVKFKKGSRYVYLYHFKKEIIYGGLLKEIIEYLKEARVPFSFCDEIKKDIEERKHFDVNDFIEKSKSWNLPFPYRKYQFKYIEEALSFNKRLIESPTGSGKSFIIYLICRYLIETNDENFKILIVTPNASLTEQLKDDFYSYNYTGEIRAITSGVSKTGNENIFITTRQSMIGFLKGTKYQEQNLEYFHDFDAILVDEAHEADSEITKGIVEQCIFAKYRYGFSGSYYKTDLDIMVLKGLFGPKVKYVSTKQLMDAGFLSEMKINVLNVIYRTEDCNFLKGSDYKSEINYIQKHEQRNEFIASLASNLKDNTLVLFRHISHGELLLELIQKRILEKYSEVYLLDGRNPLSERKKIIEILEGGINKIVIASYGIFSTGINIKKLHNIVFASPYKSSIKVAQSIGRGLRVHSDKDIVMIYDIVDNLCVTHTVNNKPLKYPRENHSFKHGLHRMDYYKHEQFDYEIIPEKLNYD